MADGSSIDFQKQLDRLEGKMDLIIRSLGLDDSHTHQEMERKAPAVVLMMQKRLTKRLQRSKKEYVSEI